MSNNRVTIRTCNDMLEADFLKSFLESHGVPVMLGQNRRMMTSVTGHYSKLAKVSLEVPADEEERALTLLQEAEEGKFAIGDDFEMEEEEEYAPAAPRRIPTACPSCGSVNIVEERNRGALNFLVNILFLGIPWLIGRRSWICADCHWHWSREDEQ